MTEAGGVVVYSTCSMNPMENEAVHPKPRDPKPETRNSKTRKTRNPKPETRNLKIENRKPKTEIRKLKPETRNQVIAYVLQKFRHCLEIEVRKVPGSLQLLISQDQTLSEFVIFW